MWYDDILKVGRVIAGATPLGAALGVVSALTSEDAKGTVVDKVKQSMDEELMTLLDKLAADPGSKVGPEVIAMVRIALR